jgi:hypothetical protein
VVEEYRQLFAAQCVYEERCAQQLGRSYSSVAACVDYNGIFLSTIADIFGGAVTFDTAFREGCLAALYGPNVSCVDPPEFPAPCDQYYRLNTPRDVGALCDESRSLCNVGLSCENDASGCGRCANRVAVGAACPGGAQCEGRASCINGTCALPPGRGQPCTGSCSGGLTCESPAPGMPSVCVERVGAGQSCNNKTCFLDLSCEGEQNARVCVAPSAEGATCSRSGNPGCVGKVCRFASANAPMGQCSNDTATPIGSPCLQSGPYSFCSQGRALTEGPPGGPPTSCTCVAYTAVGQPCTDFGECEIACVGLNPATEPPTPGVCAGPGAIGAECYADQACASGRCNNGVCAAALVCQ